MATGKFELKAGLSIKCHSKNIEVTNENLSDDLAIALLKEKPHQDRNFIKLPSNWKELVKATDAPVNTSASVEKNPAK